ncbi:LytTR family DNA-binding domain-containing protein [Nibrella saemangeumensis]|uniref:LytTR family DNA-binding domain-containing protein n=1 Tax=Nibrella saemangeumensis TaxID=1084526 RepID=A0ABP8N0C8_9BACT
MNVVIIEDESLTAQRLEKLLADYDPTIQVIAKIPSVAKAVQWFTGQPNPPDLVFMDIHLEDDIAFRIIEQSKLTVPIIFTTAYDTYTLQAFKANSIDYLLKPIDEDELAAAIDKFKALRQTTSTAATGQPDYSALMSLLNSAGKQDYKDRFMVTIGTKIRSISTIDIAYFSYEDKATWLTTYDGQHISIEYSLDKLIPLLNPKDFFRVNRAFLVSLMAIKNIHTYSGSKLKVELKPNPREEVFVSGDRITDFKEWLGK